MTEEQLAAPVLALAQAGIPPDIQELLVRGNPSRGIAPGALAKAIAAARPDPAILAAAEAERERCALVAQERWKIWARKAYGKTPQGDREACLDLAAAIRSAKEG